MGILLITLSDILGAFFSFLTYAVLARALLSWFRPDPEHVLVRLLLRVTDPILNPIHRVMPNLGGLDLSPIIAIFGIQIVQSSVVGMLVKLANAVG